MRKHGNKLSTSHPRKLAEQMWEIDEALLTVFGLR